MKRITSIVLFASIFAVAAGTLGFSGISTTSLMTSAVPQTQENFGMLGHVEYLVLDEMGNIKAYMQNDNVVVETGKDCAAQNIFGILFPVGGCITGAGDFTYIGIGNGTVDASSADPGTAQGNQTLAGGSINDETGQCSFDTGTGAGNAGGGDMARRNVTATFDSTGTSTVVTLDTSAVGSFGPFTFDVSNATAVTDSGLFNNNYQGTIVNGQCPEAQFANSGGGGSDWNMFSRQLLSAGDGITVTAGDSLSVKWTITVG